MFIVILQDRTRHSAWETRKEAIKQFEVLASHGYYGRHNPSNLSKYVKRDETVFCQNGHYYV